MGKHQEKQMTLFATMLGLRGTGCPAPNSKACDCLAGLETGDKKAQDGLPSKDNTGCIILGFSVVFVFLP